MSDCDILITRKCEVAVLSSRPGVYCWVARLLISDILKTEVALLSLKPVVCCCKTANTFYVAVDSDKYAQPCTLFGSLSYDMLIAAL